MNRSVPHLTNRSVLFHTRRSVQPYKRGNVQPHTNNNALLLTRRNARAHTRRNALVTDMQRNVTRSLRNPNPESLPGTYQQQVRLEPVVRPEKSEAELETEPTDPGPLDCREEQYPCTRLYSVHKPCKQCLNSLCFYSLRRVYVINKEVCVRTVCAHEELLRADLCRVQFSRCGVAALSGQCASLGGSCGKSCGGC